MKQKYIPLRILNEEERKNILKNLKEQFGINEIPGILLARGRERLFLFCGSLTGKEIKYIEKDNPVERVGVYFAKIVIDNGEEKIRPSIEGTQILRDQITKNVYTLNDEQAEEWMKGREIQVRTGMRGFIAIKHGKDFLGCGKASEDKITNFIPKNRRVKEKAQ